jgi:hypothetical protein
MNFNSRSSILLSGIVFVLVLGLFVIYANIPNKWYVAGYELKKNNDLQFVDFKKDTTLPSSSPSTTPKKDSILLTTIDTLPKRIIFIGDSQVEGLMYPFYDYCKFNGHDLAFVQIWYSATDMTYAANDTLKSIIDRYKPTHIVMAIGLNQIYQKYTERSEEAVKSILTTFNGIPYTWIAPANWTADFGINEMYKRTIDSGHLFLSKDLVLERAEDGRHPSKAACFIWMDSIAQWMQTKSAYKLNMKKPDTIYKVRTIPFRVLNVGKKEKKETEKTKEG